MCVFLHICRAAFDQTAEQLCEKLCEIDRWVADAVVDQVTEVFVEPSAPINHLVQAAAAGSLATSSPGVSCTSNNNIIQSTITLSLSHFSCLVVTLALRLLPEHLIKRVMFSQSEWNCFGGTPEGSVRWPVMQHRVQQTPNVSLCRENCIIEVAKGERGVDQMVLCAVVVTKVWQHMSPTMMVI